MNKKLTLSLVLVGLFFFCSRAQQDPMYTKYMWNTLSYNPAFAGTSGHMYVGLLHRTQWVNIDGAPSSQTLTFHSPLKKENVGLGLNVFNDNIGPSNMFGAYGVYSYQIPVSRKGKISIGLQGGVTRLSANYSDVKVNGSDVAFSKNVNKIMPNFGLGLYYYTDKFYMMFSSPHLVEHDLREANDIGTDFYGKYFRHYYMGTGMAIPIRGDDIIFKPSILVKAVRLFNGIRTEEAFKEIGTPHALDIDLSFLFYKKLWLGAAFRTAIEAFSGDRTSNSSANFWVNYNLDNGLRLGAAYDYTLNELRTDTPGSFELFVGYEFNYTKSKIVTPRYF